MPLTSEDRRKLEALYGVSPAMAQALLARMSQSGRPTEPWARPDIRDPASPFSLENDPSGIDYMNRVMTNEDLVEAARGMGPATAAVRPMARRDMSGDAAKPRPDYWPRPETPPEPAAEDLMPPPPFTPSRMPTSPFHRSAPPSIPPLAPSPTESPDRPPMMPRGAADGREQPPYVPPAPPPTDFGGMAREALKPPAPAPAPAGPPDWGAPLVPPGPASAGPPIPMPNRMVYPDNTPAYKGPPLSGPADKVKAAMAARDAKREGPHFGGFGPEFTGSEIDEMMSGAGAMTSARRAAGLMPYKMLSPKELEARKAKPAGMMLSEAGKRALAAAQQQRSAGGGRTTPAGSAYNAPYGGAIGADALARANERLGVNTAGDPDAKWAGYLSGPVAGRPDDAKRYLPDLDNWRNTAAGRDAHMKEIQLLSGEYNTQRQAYMDRNGGSDKGFNKDWVAQGRPLPSTVANQGRSYVSTPDTKRKYFEGVANRKDLAYINAYKRGRLTPQAIDEGMRNNILGPNAAATDAMANERRFRREAGPNYDPTAAGQMPQFAPPGPASAGRESPSTFSSAHVNELGGRLEDAYARIMRARNPREQLKIANEMGITASFLRDYQTPLGGTAKFLIGLDPLFREVVDKSGRQKDWERMSRELGKIIGVPEIPVDEKWAPENDERFKTNIPEKINETFKGAADAAWNKGGLKEAWEGIQPTLDKLRPGYIDAYTKAKMKLHEMLGL